MFHKKIEVGKIGEISKRKFRRFLNKMGDPKRPF